MAISNPTSKMDFLVENGQIIYPIALLEGIYSLDGTSLKSLIESMNRVVYATLTTDGWTQDDDGYYTQTVQVSEMKESYSPVLVKVPLGVGSSSADVKAYDKAFAILSSPIDAYTSNGSITFKVTKKPEIDIKIGLKGV